MHNFGKKVSIYAMAVLNAKEQQELRDDLRGRSYRGAKWKLRGMDTGARLRYIRTIRKSASG